MEQNGALRNGAFRVKLIYQMKAKKIHGGRTTSLINGVGVGKTGQLCAKESNLNTFSNPI